MRACRVRRSASLILATLLVAAPAAAQVSQPLQLVPPPGTLPSTSTIPQPLPPPTGGSAAGAPTGGAAADPDAAAAPSSASTPRPLGAPLPLAGSDEGIQVAPLQPVDAAWTGPLDPSQGGFPHEMWKGTPQSFVAAALPLLHPISAPALNDLTRRLLLSDATPPTPSPDTPSLLGPRIDRLYALGYAPETLALLDRLPSTNPIENVDRDRIELRFAVNDATAACRDVTALLAKHQGAWWDRAMVTCAILAGDGAKASLGMSMLADDKGPPDPTFDVLVQRITGRAKNPPKITALADPTPMRVALLVAAKTPLPEKALAEAGPAALYAYATNQAVPVEQRLAAAERAAALGALPAQSLGEIYAEIEFKPGELAATPSAIKPPADARARALLFALARLASEPATRRAAIATLALDAYKHGTFTITARLLTPAFDNLPPNDADPGFARIAARLLLAAGKTTAAQGWVTAANDRAALLLSRMAQPGRPRIDAQLVQDAVGTSKDANAARRGELLYSMLTALGGSADALAPIALGASSRQVAMPNAALWEAQQRAAQNGRLGETVLTTILICQGKDGLTTEPVVLGRAIGGLEAVGLDADAHALALQAAIDAGI